MGVRYNSGLVANRNFQAWCEQWALAALRVLKPGGYLLAFGGTRTYHRLTCAIEDAGFEIRDSVAGWIYGSGFPKSLNVSKAIDKAAGKQGKVVGERRFGTTSTGQASGWNPNAVAATGRQEVRSPATVAAEQWQGWGTALKPAWEPIVVARKPLDGTVAHNVLEHGVGAININATRIPFAGETVVIHDAPAGTLAGGEPGRGSVRNAEGGITYRENTARSGKINGAFGGNGIYGTGKPVPTGGNTEGRWPANVFFDDEAAAVLDAQSGTKMAKGHAPAKSNGEGMWSKKNGGGGFGPTEGPEAHFASGGASRFFYHAKANRRERDSDAWGEPIDLPEEPFVHAEGRSAEAHGGTYEGHESALGYNRSHPVKNNHPTVKSVSVMRWLLDMVVRNGGTVLDPFAGSGTTAVAAIQRGLEDPARAINWIAIERREEYAEIAAARTRTAIQHTSHQEASND